MNGPSSVQRTQHLATAASCSEQQASRQPANVAGEPGNANKATAATDTFKSPDPKATGGYLGGPHFEHSEINNQEGVTVVIPPDDHVLRSLGTAPLDMLGAGQEPGVIGVLIWNIAKGNSAAWRHELESLSDGADLILNQEVAFYPGSRSFYEDSEHRFDLAISWINLDSFGPTGVITGSMATPSFVGYLRSPDREPVYKTPKMTLATKYPLADAQGQQLLVVNTHAINFVNSGAYERQILSIEAAIAEHDGPVLWAGDLNTWSGGREAVLNGAAKRLGLHRVQLTGKDPWLDRAFVRGLSVDSAVGIGGTRNSDHPALRLRLRIGQEQTTASTLHELLTAADSDQNGERLHTLLAGASAEDFNHAIDVADVTALVARFDDYRGSIRDSLFDLLSVQRLEDLDVSARARIIGAMQRGPTSRREERIMTRFILATHGTELTTLKNLINTGTDKFDLEKLVFHDIDDDDLRTKILDHFEREGALSPMRRRLISDIDDTVFCLLKDERVPKDTVYPGARQFHLEMDPGILGDQSMGDRVFLTASPQSIETRRHGTLSDLGFPQRAILSGSVASLRSAAAQAKKKIANFTKLKKLYPEYRFCFVGDSGGADVIVAEEMARRAQTPMDNLLIHDIGNLTDARRDELRAAGIGLFSTYVGAAMQAYQRGLMSAQAALRVAKRAPGDLDDIEFESEQQQQTMRRLLADDIEALHSLLGVD